MKEQNQSNQKPKKHKARKILIVIAVILLALILIVSFVIPAFISSESGRKTILTKINKSVEGTTDFASLSMGWFSGIKLTDLSFDDDVGRTSVRIKQIQTKPHYASIIAGNLSFGKTIIDQPQISINLKDDTPASPKTTRTPEQTKQSPKLPLTRIDLLVNDGSLRITDPKENTVELQQINSSLNLRPPPKPTKFDLTAQLTDQTNQSPIKAGGTIKPKVTKDGLSLAGTSADLNIEVNDLQLESLESFFALAGLDLQSTGKASGKITGAIKNGQLQQLNARLKGQNIQITGQPLKGDTFKTSTLSVTSAIQRREGFINIANLDINADWLQAKASGDAPMTFKSFADFIKTKSQQNLKAEITCDVAKLASQMPRTLGIKQDTILTSGTLTANIEKTDQPALIAQARLDNLSGLVSNKPVRLSQPVISQARITADAKKIRFEKLNLSSSFADVDCSGTSDSLEYKANVNLALLQSELGQFLNMAGYQMAGIVESNGKLTAAGKKYQLNGSSAAKNLSVTSPGNISVSEPAATANYTLDIEPEASLLTIKSLQTNAAFGRVDIRDSVIPLKKDSSNKLSLNIVAKALNLARVMPFAELFSPTVRDIRLSGLADSELLIKPDEQGLTIRTDSTKISNFEFAFKDKKPFKQDQVSIKLDSRIEPAKLTAKGSLVCPEISISFDVDKTIDKETTKLKGAADLDYDWKHISRLLSAFMPDELLIEGKNKTAIEFTSTYPADKPDRLLANLATKPVKVAFDKAQYRGFTVTEPSQIQVKFDNGLLDIPEFSMKVNEGTFTFAGQADFKQTSTVFRTPKPMNILQNVKIDERVSSKLLQYINPIFKDVDRISGTANFSCQTLAIPLRGASKRDLELDGTFSISNMRMISPIFSLIQRVKGGTSEDSLMQLRPTRITAKNGLVRYDNMQLDVGNNPFNFVGRIDLMTKSIEGTKVITPYTTGRTVRIGEENTPGRITGSFIGTYDRPELDWGSLILDTLIQEGLKEVLKNL